MIQLPFDPNLASGLWALMLAIVLATLISEDLTCIATGVLIGNSQLDWLPAIGACWIGIVLGDLGVWLLARSGARWIRGSVSSARLAELEDWISRRGRQAAFVSRVLPGTRVPLLIAAGIAPHGGVRYLLWAALAAMFWTPLIIVSVAKLGHLMSTNRLFAILLTAYLVARIGPMLATRIGRAQLIACGSRLWRWEFWPAWVFYLPLVPWFCCLAIRYRSVMVWTAANPGIHPAGGVAGESKAEILAILPTESIVPTILVPPGELPDRMQTVLGAIAQNAWEFPLILKPDVGERGAGVRKVNDAVDLEKYLRANPGPVIVQPFHPGPYEAGVFYYRVPNEDHGHIFSITDKVFPIVIGDGRSTLEELIWQHARYRMQARKFLERHSASIDRVLADGEPFVLATAGNHCQGTMFRDGGHLITQELECAFDRIAQKFKGFNFGRFDVRYADPDELRAGRGFAIVELNGVSSESTNLYDPTWSLVQAYRTLYRQWSLLFQIGDANRRLGHRPTTVIQLLRLLHAHSRDRQVQPLSD